MNHPLKRNTKPHFVAAMMCAVCVSACTNSTPHTRELGPGVQYSARMTNYGRYDYVRIDLSLAQCTMHWKDEDGQPLKTFAALRAYLQTKNTEPLFITNGGIYQPDLTPGGLFVEEGEKLHGLNLNDGEGNFHLKPNGVFAIKGTTAYIIDSEDYDAAKLDPDYAVQSGPLLVKNSEIHPAFNPASENRYIRSGVGVGSDGTLLFAISERPVTFYEFASFFKNHRSIENALYLDGAISTFSYKDGPNAPQPTAYSTMIAVSPRTEN